MCKIKEASELQDIAENTYPCKCCGRPIFIGDYCIVCEKKKDEILKDNIKQDSVEDKIIEDKENEDKPMDKGYYGFERH